MHVKYIHDKCYVPLDILFLQVIIQSVNASTVGKLMQFLEFRTKLTVWFGAM